MKHFIKKIQIIATMMIIFVSGCDLFEMPSRIILPHSLGGTLSGLTAGTVTLQNNGVDDLALTTNGSFQFNQRLDVNSAYHVTVLSTPPGMSCAVTNGDGTIGEADISDISVSCGLLLYKISGTITGYSGSGLVLTNNGIDDLVIPSGSTTFEFTTKVQDSGAYSVAVKSNPTSPIQTCSPTSGVGIVQSADVTNISIACSSITYTISVNVTGYDPSTGLTLINNSEVMNVSGDGLHTFTQSVAAGSIYSFSIQNQPVNPWKTCIVINGGPTTITADVTININCSVNSYWIGGSVSGLQGSGLVAQLNGDAACISNIPAGATTFDFGSGCKINSGANFNVTLSTATTINPIQTCSLSGGTGTVGGADVNTVAIGCSTFYTVGGTILGLLGSNFQIMDIDSGHLLNPTADGTYAFPAIADLSSYNINITYQPQGAPNNIWQTCSISNPTGSLNGTNKTDAGINCNTNSYKITGSINGLSGSGLTLLLNSGCSTGISSGATAFDFGTACKLTSGTSFTVRVTNQPSSQNCSISNGFGTVAGSDISSVSLSCTATGGFPSGYLDTSFGSGGKVTTSLNAALTDMKIQSWDQKIIAVGTESNTNMDFILVRYNSNGSLDSTFGTAGKVTTTIGSGDDRAQSVVLQSDQKIVVGGYSINGANNDFAVVRYNADGSIDTTFGTGGKVITPIGASDDRSYGIAIQSDQKIIMVGDSFDGTANNFSVVRYNTDGSLDSTFGSAGKVITSLSTTGSIAYDVAVQLNQKIIVSGSSNNGLDNDFAVVRYNTDGSLDTSFGVGGIAQTDIQAGSNDVIYGVYIQTNGNIIVAGSSDLLVFSLARFDASGVLDQSFGTGGLMSTPVTVPPGQQAECLAITLQSDGKIMTGGYVTPMGSWPQFTVARFNSNGSLDNTFDLDGYLTTTFSPNPISNSVNAIAIQSDGKIVAAGQVPGTGFAIARYWP